MGTAAEGKNRFRPGTGILVCLFLLLVLPGFAGAEGRIVEYRLPVQMEEQETAGDGETVFVGKKKKKGQYAQLLLDPARGSIRGGGTAELSRLLEEEKGTVLSAFWRVKVTGNENERFALWPRGNEKGILTARMTEGWNLWEITPLIRELGKSGKPLSLRLMLADETRKGGARFDLKSSWIDIRIRAEKGSRASLIQEENMLDSAFSALPESHWILQRYRELTDAILLPEWPESGAPYYFGGHLAENVLRPFTPDQASNYYREGKYYLGGFDCIGFIRWAEEKAGKTPMSSLEEVLSARSGFFPVKDRDPRSWTAFLQPGDLLLFDHGSLHVGICIGTPRQYGLTEENTPDLAGWLDAPMMIHCGEDPFVYRRFSAYIETLSYRRISVTPPDGGVTVSVLVSSPGDAPNREKAPWGKEYGYFRVMGQEMTAFPVSDCGRIAWNAD